MTVERWSSQDLRCVDDATDEYLADHYRRLTTTDMHFHCVNASSIVFGKGNPKSDHENADRLVTNIISIVCQDQGPLMGMRHSQAHQVSSHMHDRVNFLQLYTTGTIWGIGDILRALGQGPRQKFQKCMAKREGVMCEQLV